MNYKDYVKEKLSNYEEKDIIITLHVEIRALQRQIKLEEIKENLINPEKLYYAVKEKAENKNEEKFDCYFGYSKTQCHRYIIAINSKVIVVTAIKINRRWQIIAEKKLKRQNTKR